MDGRSGQQNLHYVYPQVFCIDGTAGGPPIATAPPIPLRRLVKKRRDGTWLCLLAVTMLVFVALAGVGLAIYKFLRLQKELDLIKKPFASSGEFTSAMERYIGKSNTNSLPLDWEHTQGRAFLDGVLYVNKGLIINETGLYFIYSNVYFRWRECENKPLSHIIYKRASLSRVDMVLLEGRKTNYCANRGMWARSSSLAAVFNLTRSDSLYVNVSEVSLVGFDETKTFFGLYKL